MKKTDVVCLLQGGEAYGRNTIINCNNIHIILYYSLIGVTIITFALIIVLAVILSKQK